MDIGSKSFRISGDFVVVESKPRVSFETFIQKLPLYYNISYNQQPYPH